MHLEPLTITQIDRLEWFATDDQVALLIDHTDVSEKIVVDDPMCQQLADVQLRSRFFTLMLDKQQRLVDTFERPDRVFLKGDR